MLPPLPSIARPPGRPPGFTLLELLVAVLLLAMISTMIYSALRESINFSARGEARLQELARRQGLLELLGRQVREAWFDARQRRIQVTQEHDMLQIYTRFSLLHRDAGLVLAIYRYDQATATIYYLEKLDFYNAGYRADFVPPLAEMQVLARLSTPFAFAYDPRTDLVTVSLGQASYEFLPRCHPVAGKAEGLS